MILPLIGTLTMAKLCIVGALGLFLGVVCIEVYKFTKDKLK